MKPSLVHGGRAAGRLDVRGRRRARDERLRLRARLSRLSSLPSVQCCGRSVLQSAGQVTVLVGDGVAGVAGLQTCSSVSACPVCSARIRESRARTIEATGVAHLRARGRLLFLTLTLPHDTGDPLVALLDTVLNGWRSVQQDRHVRDLGARYGLDFGGRSNRFGFVRSVEVTHGRSGWHPHLHVLLFVAEDAGTEALSAIGDAIKSAWTVYVADRPEKWRPPTQLDVRVVAGRTGHAGLLRYLSKVQDGFDAAASGRWSLGREMARGDAKGGRRWHTRLPFDLAAEAAAGGVNALRLWHEYEQASKGRRVVTASQGLYALLGVAQVVDELAPEVADGVEVAVLLPEDWRAVLRMRAIPQLLGAAETGGSDAVWDLVLTLRGWRDALEAAGQAQRVEPTVGHVAQVWQAYRAGLPVHSQVKAA